MEQISRVIVLISANVEWEAVRELIPVERVESSPYGEYFAYPLVAAGKEEQVIFFHGGWGKIAAAGSTQYVIDRWDPELLVNLGTCGGFEGRIERGTILLVEKTIVYDILEQMGDHAAHIAHYTTEIDLSWLDGKGYPQPVVHSLLVSGDRDLVADEIPVLAETYGAAAGDWESGAIAYVAARNRKRLLILRGVTDLVGPGGGEAYEGKMQFFVDAARGIMACLLDHLGEWVERSVDNK